MKMSFFLLKYIICLVWHVAVEEQLQSYNLQDKSYLGTCQTWSLLTDERNALQEAFDKLSLLTREALRNFSCYNLNNVSCSSDEVMILDTTL